jgi:hypothetical protein
LRIRVRRNPVRLGFDLPGGISGNSGAVTGWLGDGTPGEPGEQKTGGYAGPRSPRRYSSRFRRFWNVSVLESG